MPISRQDLEKLRSLGDTQTYSLASGDSLSPTPMDMFVPKAEDALSAVRNLVGVNANPVLPVTQPNLLQQQRLLAGVKGQTTGEEPVPESQKKSPILGEALKKVLSKTASRKPTGITQLKDADEESDDEEDVPEQKKPYSSKQALLEASKLANQNDQANSMLEGALGLGAALGRSKADYTGLENLRKTGQNPLETYQNLQNQNLNDQKIQEGIDKQALAQAENDPNHPISQAVRETLGKLGLKVDPNTTAKQLRDQGVDIGKLLGIKEQAETRKLNAQIVAQAKKGTLDQKQDLQDQRIHTQVMRQIDMNPNVKARVQQIQNLDNSLAMLSAFPEGATPQQIADAQQLIVRNMGIQGQSGVGERAERYIHTAGMKGAGILQFITGDPVYLSQNSNLMNYIRHQANTERSNANKQLLNTVNMVSSGHGSLYARNPELLNDLKDKVSTYQGIMEAPVNASTSNIPVAPKGKVNVINPEGKTGFIPEDQLEDALKQGYKKV